MTGSNELSMTIKCDYHRGLYRRAAGGRWGREEKINKVLLLPKNKPLFVVTPMSWCQLGQGFSVTCMMKKKSWFKSCHCEKTQFCINSISVTCFNRMQTTLSGSRCVSSCHIRRQLNWFMFAFSFCFIPYVWKIKEMLFSFSLLLGTTTSHIFLVSLWYMV